MSRRKTENLPELAERREQVIRLRAEGLTWDEVARRTGYANGSGALKAFRAACKDRPSRAIDELRQQETERLDVLFAVTASRSQTWAPG